MACEVYANGMCIACKAAAGKTIAAMPDVCLSPPSPPAGPAPIPYPNTAMASDTSDGSKTVQINGQEVMLKDQSTFKKSTGDEAATKGLGMGVVTHQIQGKVSFTSWSMDVKFEGQNIPRHLDLTLHNEMSMPANTPPWPYVDTMAPSNSAKKQLASLKVLVRNRCNDNPVENAVVTVAGRTMTTDAGGQATFDKLAASYYGVTAAKHFADCDYVTFVVQYPAVFIHHKAQSAGSGSIALAPGQAGELTIHIEVFRPIERMVFHRRNISFSGGDKYGHWWTVVDTNLSFGWWPKYPLGHPANRASVPPTPPTPLPPDAGWFDAVQHAFSSAVYSVQERLFNMRESSLGQTFRGVEGELNGQTSFGGTSTQDPHDVGGDSGDEQYQPVIHDCRTDSQIRQCAVQFAQSYAASSGGTWSWRLEFGNQCHTFQKRLMAHCKVDDVKKLK